MYNMEKYFAPFNFDKTLSILAVSIKARLPFDFACVVCTLGICLLTHGNLLLVPLFLLGVFLVCFFYELL